MSPCPRCESADCVSRITKERTSMTCADCGLQRELELTKHPRFGQFLAVPRVHGPRHHAHPHHYLAAMLAFLAFAAVMIFIQVSHLASALL